MNYIQVPKCCLTCNHCHRTLSTSYTDYLDYEDMNNNRIWVDTDINYRCEVTRETVGPWDVCENYN